MTSIEIPNSVTSIGKTAFIGCYGLASIEIPSSVTSIGASAFNGCTSLSSIEIPNTITIINQETFASCTGLTSIKIPNSVTSIEESAFRGCTSLTSVDIPNSVISIGINSFGGCSGLTSFIIPNSVSTIYRLAFQDCISLISVTIGNGVTSIGERAFYNCQDLTDIYCRTESVPGIESNTFENSYIEYATLHVPVGSVEDYQTAGTWSNFNRIIDYDEVNISANNIRTYSSPFDLDLTNVSGLSAYVISNFDASEGTLTLTPVTTVKAGEGLLLKGDAGDYEIPYTTTDATYTNYLVGVPSTITVSPTDGEYTNFILADGSHGVNFYALSKTGDISGGKAYLQLPTAALDGANTSRGFSFEDDGSTAIKQINVEYKDTTFYDLQGRRVIRPSKGLYIVNGKKVIIK